MPNLVKELKVGVVLNRGTKKPLLAQLELKNTPLEIGLKETSPLLM